MGSFKMRLLLIATSLALVAAAPHNEDRQKWRPAQGRDLSKFKPKLPEVAFRAAAPTSPRPKPFEFKKGKGVCNGDSGGTLNIRQTEGGNKWTQVGVTSFVSSAGCESGNPHGFSRVAEHLEWIETVTGLSLT